MFAVSSLPSLVIWSFPCGTAAAAARLHQSCLTLQPHRRQPTRLHRPWDSPGKNTGVGCHCLLQCMKVKSEREVTQSCLTLNDPMDCSLPGSSIHGIFQARVLEWVASAFSDKESNCQCRRHKRFGFDPWVEKIPWRRAWQPTPGFLSRESNGPRSLVGYSP